jgi:PAT family beta-lactamase induction signal transducer AmpG
VPRPDFFSYTLAVFWLLAFSSATHDIAADGFYMLALPPHQQAAFVGVRSTFYRVATLAGQGGLVYLAGTWQKSTGSFAQAWALVFWLVAAFFVLAALWHAAVLPQPGSDRAVRREPQLLAGFVAVFVAFFRKPGIGRILAFLLLYRFAEAQLLNLVTPFLLDTRTDGRLGLTTQQVGVVYGAIGVIALTLGGLVGGWIISRYGLRRLLWPMIIVMHVPNAVFVLLAWLQPSSSVLIGTAVAVEQFAYGFGFTAYLLYMIMVADGEHKTAHYAICTGFMALGMMLPGMAAGWLQDHLGYTNFFVWVCIATIFPLIAAALIKIDGDFGKKA